MIRSPSALSGRKRQWRSYPSTRTLSIRLRAMLSRHFQSGGDVEILERAGDPHESTFPTEIVTCRVGGAAAVRLFCKYPRPARCAVPAWHRAHGHRHGIAYEAKVYQHVLAPLDLTPRFVGTGGGTDGRAWLAVEYLDECLRIKSVPSGPERAAAWLGWFHAAVERRLAERPLRFLHRYTADFYAGWSRRTVRYAHDVGRNRRAIALARDAYERAIPLLLALPLTVAHGEFYPSNILCRAGSVHPVDWESAAVAAGEVDLACLTEHWSPRVVKRCEAAYARARWPRGADAMFATRLAVARLYGVFRWAGRARAWDTPESRAFYLERLIAEHHRLDEARLRTGA